MSKKTPPALMRAEIIYREVDSLIGYARNSRKHDEAQVAAIAASMVEYGFTQPVLVADGTIIAGHGRVMAARRVWEAGKEISNCPQGQVPTIDLSHLTATQRRAYVIADNALAERASWDKELLAVELHDLKAESFDLNLVGFEVGELTKIMYPNAGKKDEEGEGEAENEMGGQFAVIVVCADEDEQKTVYEKLIADGLDAKVVSN